MYFNTKNYLKNTYNYTVKHALIHHRSMIFRVWYQDTVIFHYVSSCLVHDGRLKDEKFKGGDIQASREKLTLQERKFSRSHFFFSDHH
jgi:hypothetical protein